MTASTTARPPAAGVTRDFTRIDTHSAIGAYLKL